MNVPCFGRDIYGEGFSFYCFIPVSAIVRKLPPFMSYPVLLEALTCQLKGRKTVFSLQNHNF